MHYLTRLPPIAPVVVFGLSVVLYLLTGWLLGVGLIDDAYIFFRYADNIQAGHGLVFNPGERVEGYSSPLWLGFLTIAVMLGLEVEPAALVIGYLFGLLTLLVFIYTGQKYLASGLKILVLIPAWFLATSPPLVYWAASGLESALFVFLFFLSCLVFLHEVKQEGPMTWSGICFALTALARVDVLVLLPVYLISIAICSRGKQHLLSKYLSFLLPQMLLVVHLVWRYSYYGVGLPNTYYAKLNVPDAALVSRGVEYTLRFGLAYAPLLIALVLVFVIAARRAWTFRIEMAIVLTITFTWTAYVIYVGGDHFPLYRFYVPLLPLLALLLTVLLGRIAGSMKLRSFPSKAVVLSSLVLVTAFNYHIYSFQLEGTCMQGNIRLTRNWVEVGHWLRANVHRDATIASIVVGAIPYYSGLQTIDLLGLTDREIATEGKVELEAEVGHQKFHTDYVLARKPEYIIYSSSGQYAEPIYRDPDKITVRYAYALRNLAQDQRTRELYEYEVVRMSNGRVIEFLRLKESGR